MTSTPDYFVLFADVLRLKQLVLQHQVPYPENLDLEGEYSCVPSGRTPQLRLAAR
jgi:hypothetical protein